MGKKVTVDIVIPVYNEEIELESHVMTLLAYCIQNMPEYSVQVVIADNASTDSTYRIARSLSKRNRQIRVIHLDQKGRGRAVKRAWLDSTADVVSYMDVDLSTDLKHLPPLIDSLFRGYDIAIGSRNNRASRVYGRNALRTITSKGYIMLIKMFFFVRFSDAQCGFKAMTTKAARELLPSIIDNEWFFDTELLINAEKRGYRIYEEPVTWIDNPGSTVRVIKTAQGDLKGLWRLFTTRPWHTPLH